jgi:hypothetical protein
MMGRAGGLGGFWVAGRPFKHDLMKECAKRAVLNQMKNSK